MKNLITVLILYLFCYVASGKQIDQITAKLIGKNFIVSFGNMTPNIDLTLEYRSSSKSIDTTINFFYIFNFIGTKGFVIVSADDKVSPILAYSLSNSFISTNLPSNISYWLETYSGQIKQAINVNLLPSDKITNEWKNLLSGSFIYSLKRAGSVSPLLQTKWNQAPYFNDLCPYDNLTKQNTVTGCVATTMAQIMKYWNYPDKGIGSESYSDPIYGYQYANFGSTSYNLSKIPNQITSPNNDAAVLMYHCGVSVHMNYNIDSKGGSGAFVLASQSTFSAENAYISYFGYNSKTISGVYRSSYSESDWINILKKELDNGRPIQYAGFGGNGTIGHTWVCDGYNSLDFFNMNWGWGGQSDGYYNVNSLLPSNTNYNFNKGQLALIGIEPPTNNCKYMLSKQNTSFSSYGGTGSFDILTSSNCNWTAISNNVSWITITSASNGKGSGTIQYKVDPNNTNNTIQGSITIAGQVYTITQTGINCTYNISPSSSQFLASGGNGSFSVTSPSGCDWSAVSNDPSWLHVTSNSYGSGNSTIYYSVDQNYGINSLTGTISVTGQTHIVKIDGVNINCSVKIIPASELVISNYQGNYSFVFDINSSCSYNVLSSSPEWLTIKSADNNVVHFDVSENKSWFPKTGFIHINSDYKKIIQLGNPNLGINDITILNSFNVYPNPSNGNLSLEFESKKNDQIKINITNSTGQEVYNENDKLSAGQLNIFNIKLDVPAGIYNIAIQSCDGILNKRITIL